MNAGSWGKYNALFAQICFLSRGYIKQSECIPPTQVFPQLDPRKPFSILFSGARPAVGGLPAKTLQDQSRDLH